jgi:hypothetical protein
MHLSEVLEFDFQEGATYTIVYVSGRKRDMVARWIEGYDLDEDLEDDVLWPCWEDDDDGLRWPYPGDIVQILPSCGPW